MNAELAEKLQLAHSLKGKFVRFHHEEKIARGRLVIGVTVDGMIVLDGLAGEFAPHLFVKVDRPHTAAPGNS